MEFKLQKDLSWNEDMLGYVKSLHEQRLTDLEDHHREMYMNVLWAVIGRQDIVYYRPTKSLMEYKPPKWKTHVISNFLFPQVRRNVAKLARKPIWDVIPWTSDQDDIDVANLSTQLLRYYWHLLGMDVKFIEFLFWLATTGNAHLKVGWDPDRGDAINLSDEERAIIARVTDRKRIPKSIKTGEIFCEVCSPFSVFWEPGVALKDSSWMLHVKLRSPDYIWKRWKKEIKPQQHVTGRQYDYHLMNMAESAINFSASTDKVLTYEFWTPERVILFAGDEVLAKAKNKYGDYPMIHTREVPIPGSEHGTGPVRQNRPNQALYNMVRGVVVDHAKSMLAQKWLVPHGSGITDGSLTSKAGEVVRYHHPFVPSVVAPKPLPNFVNQLTHECKVDMMTTGSANPVSQARGEPNLRSGKAVLALQDADDLVLGPVSQMVDSSLADIGHKILRLIADNVTEDRMARLAGDDRSIEIVKFNGSDLVKGTSGGKYDVRVAAWSSYPLSRQGIEERLDWMLERGVLNPQTDRNMILHMVGSGDVQSVFGPAQQLKTLYHRKCVRLEAGERVPVYPMDDHKIALEELDNYFRPKMEDLSDEAFQAVMEYREGHEKYIQQAQQQQMMMMERAKNAGRGSQ
jgi:hypothetical protein